MVVTLGGVELQFQDPRVRALSYMRSEVGVARSYGLNLWRNRRLAWLVDRLYDARLEGSPAFKALLRQAAASEPRRVLVVGVALEGREEMMQSVLRFLRSDIHGVTYRTGLAGGRGKLENINRLLAECDLDEFDWVLMTDDDVAGAGGFLDRFVAVCSHLDLRFAMPAHRFSSYCGYEITRRGWGTLARTTHFVEVGPLVAFHRSTFGEVFPLPELKYGWGLDLTWPALASARGWRMGVVDATPVRHLRPIGKSYPREEALEEACGYLATHPHLPRELTFSIEDCWRA